MEPANSSGNTGSNYRWPESFISTVARASRLAPHFLYPVCISTAAVLDTTNITVPALATTLISTQNHLGFNGIMACINTENVGLKSRLVAMSLKPHTAVYWTRTQLHCCSRSHCIRHLKPRSNVVYTVWRVTEYLSSTMRVQKNFTKCATSRIFLSLKMTHQMSRDLHWT